MTQGDPTDHALATIASILDQPEPQRPTEKPVAEGQAATLAPANHDSYVKFGPGPMAAIRLKWTVRRTDHGEFFVDETIGDNSTPVTTGPMTKEAAIRLVDDRESDARRRFDQIRAEMSGSATTLDVIRKGDES